MKLKCTIHKISLRSNFTTRNSIKQYFIYAEKIREGFQKFKKQMVLILAITTILTIIIILLLPMKGIKDVIIM